MRICSFLLEHTFFYQNDLVKAISGCFFVQNFGGLNSCRNQVLDEIKRFPGFNDSWGTFGLCTVPSGKLSPNILKLFKYSKHRSSWELNLLGLFNHREKLLISRPSIENLKYLKGNRGRKNLVKDAAPIVFQLLNKERIDQGSMKLTLYLLISHTRVWPSEMETSEIHVFQSTWIYSIVETLHGRDARLSTPFFSRFSTNDLKSPISSQGRLLLLAQAVRESQGVLQEFQYNNILKGEFFFHCN